MFPLCSEDTDNVKAYFRRAVAKHCIGDYVSSKEDFQSAKRLDPSLQQEVEREEARLAAKMRASEARQRREMTSFFNYL